MLFALILLLILQQIILLVTPELILILLLNLAFSLLLYTMMFLFLLWFVSITEQLQMRSLWPTLGFHRQRIVPSILWSLGGLIVASVITMFLFQAVLLFPLSSAGPTEQNLPPWYIPVYTIYAFIPVALVEETLFRGYMLERILPPSDTPRTTTTLLKATTFVACLHSLWHAPTYLLSGQLLLAPLLFLNAFIFSFFIGITYAKTHNITGSIIVHGLADAIPLLFMIII